MFFQINEESQTHFGSFLLTSAVFQHFSAVFVKITSRDATWRHHVGFSPNIHKMFPTLIPCLCPNMKLIAWFLKKLWQLTFFPALVWRYRGRCYFTPNARHLTKHNFGTTYRIKAVDPSLESPGAALYREVCLVTPYRPIFADVSTFCGILRRKSVNDVIWRHVTSRRRIFTKLSQNVSLLHILLVSKFKVICICLAKVMAISLFYV